MFDYTWIFPLELSLVNTHPLPKVSIVFSVSQRQMYQVSVLRRH